MGSLLVISGPPGAGKSAVAQQIAGTLDSSVVVAGDVFFGFVAGGAIEPWLPAANAQNTIVLEAAASATGRFVHGGYNTIYEGVVGPWFIAAFARFAAVDHLDYAILLPPVDVCVERVLRREDHSFRSEAAARQLHGEFVKATVESKHIIDSSLGSHGETADLILDARKRNRLAYE